MGITAEQAAAIESKYRGYKIAYCSDLPLDTSPPVPVLTADQIARIESRIILLRQVAQAYNTKGGGGDGSIISHLIGELIGRLKLNKRMLEMKSPEEWERLNNLSDAQKSLERWTTEHPEMRVGYSPR